MQILRKENSNKLTVIFLLATKSFPTRLTNMLLYTADNITPETKDASKNYFQIYTKLLEHNLNVKISKQRDK